MYMGMRKYMLYMNLIALTMCPGVLYTENNNANDDDDDDDDYDDDANDNAAQFI